MSSGMTAFAAGSLVTIGALILLTLWDWLVQPRIDRAADRRYARRLAVKMQRDER